MRKLPVGSRAFALTIAAAVALAAGAAMAQQPYPNHAIKILVGIPPGGAPDVVARLVGHYLSESLGQPVVIENRTGANGNIATEAVAAAPADGYTLLLGADSAIAINPHIFSMKSDPIKDLVPVTSVATNQFVLAV
ncbi:MAG: tripartite tricarboxylate transporter substrate-binding protein, partial [Hyphomicrobiales bacterium]